MLLIIKLQTETSGLWDLFWTLWDWVNANSIGVVSMIITGIVAFFLWRWSKGVASGGPRGLLVGGLTIVVFLISFSVTKYVVNIFPTVSVGFTNSIVDGMNNMPIPVLPGTPVPDAQPSDNNQPPVKLIYALSQEATLRDGPSTASNFLDDIPVNTLVCVLRFHDGDGYCEAGVCRRAEVKSLPNLYTFPPGWVHEATLGATQGPCP